MYIAYIQPFMYTIIHTQTTSVGTDLICWTWTVSINITSLKLHHGYFLTSLLLPPTNAQKEPDFTPTRHLKILAHFLLLSFTHKLTYATSMSADFSLAVSWNQPFNSCQPVCIFVYHVRSSTPKNWAELLHIHAVFLSAGLANKGASLTQWFRHSRT